MSTILRDFQHAARMFVDDKFRLAPKSKFLFHVSISINPGACKNGALVQRHKNEINMLVKNLELPSFAPKIETLNQYNRKKNVQYTIEYNPLTITFHDDNMGIINQVWQNYFNYYYADPSSAEDPAAYKRNAMKNFSYIKNAYGLNNGSKEPFFNYIKLYQMGKHEYVSYKLYNPIISRWNHNKVDYASSELHDNSMEIRFEAVSYKAGKVSKGDPEGFAIEHYDQTPSPNKGKGGGSGKGGAGQTGGGGVASAGVAAGSASPSFADSAANNTAAKVNNLTKTINTYQNTALVPLAGSTGIATTNSIAKTSAQTVGGLQGITFPVINIPSPTVVASQVKFK